MLELRVVAIMGILAGRGSNGGCRGSYCTGTAIEKLQLIGSGGQGSGATQPALGISRDTFVSVRIPDSRRDFSWVPWDGGWGYPDLSRRRR